MMMVHLLWWGRVRGCGNGKDGEVRLIWPQLLAGSHSGDSGSDGDGIGGSGGKGIWGSGEDHDESGDVSGEDIARKSGNPMHQTFNGVWY
ncbi:hypothetical protein Tco_1410243 [Tanacetum coccineum]